jgi:putative FmdB family regulatory protein
MPIYEYQCHACGHELEAIQKFSDDPLSECPECGQPSLKKMISATAFRLKGDGWYETDFKQGTKKNLHESGGKESAPSACSAGKCCPCE